MDYDLIVIGSGPSGRAAAIQAGKLKRKVWSLTESPDWAVSRCILGRSRQKHCEKLF